MKPIHTLLFALTAICGAAENQAPQKSAVAPAESHQTRNIEGWTVHISDRLLHNATQPTDKALELIANELDITMAFTGHTDIRTVDRGVLLPGTY